ncbi:hypothetical protein Poly41_63450 [Novipirellula artificiosorum]|uniref:DUF1592 domain-containing protein n=1 Tax=Novipirellula artificiosorum TaxID=2528016 RepID=A0A5C6D5N4_9BACT|nr:hypothetical protein Poly41_63450 [Novipirellula artificiosorum]
MPSRIPETPIPSNTRDSTSSAAAAGTTVPVPASNAPIGSGIYHPAAPASARVTATTSASELLGDPRSKRFVSGFTGQWMDLRKIHDTSPDRDLFPESSSDNLVVDSSVAETNATFTEMLRENLPAKTIVDADFVMVNERLAELYDIERVKGQDIRRVALPTDSPNGGLLPQSSVIKVTANGLTTSPVLRGVWVSIRPFGPTSRAPADRVRARNARHFADRVPDIGTAGFRGRSSASGHSCREAVLRG